MKRISHKILLLLLSLMLIFPSVGLAATTTLLLGVQDQPLEDIQVSEPFADTFKTGTYITATLPSGIVFSETPTLEVIKGDIQIGAVSTGLDANQKGYLRLKLKVPAQRPAPLS
ncbi:hypothetical protein N752_01820 [Desulforamulus aquiferis]|nr:hypothetical protein [Desulforamulus aquiferis]RYD06890.1 hypothetical protein N752_01820 [Desulforamulus aquiferis]